MSTRYYLIFVLDTRYDECKNRLGTMQEAGFYKPTSPERALAWLQTAPPAQEIAKYLLALVRVSSATALLPHIPYLYHTSHYYFDPTSGNTSADRSIHATGTRRHPYTPSEE